MNRALFSIELLESRTLLAYTPPVSPRATIDFDPGWKFIRSNPASAQLPTVSDSTWSSVNLPHTWNIADGQDGGNNYYRGVGWYRKNYVVPSNYSGKRLVIRFGAAALTADVFVNGSLIGTHQGGYAAFAFDITGSIKFGKNNLIAVKVNNALNSAVAPTNDDWTVAGGLYREVDLIVLPKLQFNITSYASPGVFLTPGNVSSTSANLTVRSDLRNFEGVSRALRTRTTLVDQAGNIVAQGTSSALNMNARAAGSITQTLTIARPRLWNGVIDPYRYRAYIEVLDSAGVTNDLVTQQIGFRSFSVDPQRGFILNGKPYDLRGAAIHQDRKDIGVARTPADRAADIRTLLQMGATSVRLAHYQYADDMYETLDAAGVVTWTEVPFVFSFDNTTAFKENLKQQLRELIRQQYNRPSVCFWGLFNEIYQSTATSNFVGELNALAHAEDPTRPTTGASSLEPGPSINNQVDLITFNRYTGWYSGTFQDFAGFVDNALAANPNRGVGIGEYGAGASIYQHEEDPQSVVANSRYHPEEYQNKFHEAYWTTIKSQPRLFWKTVWNLFDFASDRRSEGDALGWNDKGLVTADHATAKDAYYFYRANWSSKPTLYITSRRFTDRVDADTPIKIYSNVGPVTLKVNGRVIGTVTPNDIDVATWASVILRAGPNTISVSGVRDGVTYTDTCTWTLRTASKAFSTEPVIRPTSMVREDREILSELT